MAVIWSDAASNASEMRHAASSAVREGFRPEVQGLRALAVIGVVLFHLWPAAIPGGFVGVDIFFVISGYLITGLLFRELQQTGRISLLGFYARRARRLLPAASLVLILVALATPLMPPARWDDTSLGIIASALYVENWHLAWLAVDYLGSEDPPSAVQHYWSLSVEEQFYFIWPLIMIAASAVALRSGNIRQRLLVPLGAVVALSFGASVWLTATNPAAAYFVTHTRLWELGLGALIAIAVLPDVSQRVRETMRWLGIASILIAVFAFSGQTPFPGYAALLPTAGCGLILAAGPDAAGRWSVSRLLTWRPAQYVGDISYSMYLWHWPVIIFAGFYAPEGVGVALGAGLLGFTLALSALTKRFVEDPVRYRRLGDWKAIGFGALSVASCVVAATIIYKYVGLEMIRSFDDSPDYPGAQAFLENAPVPVVASPIPPMTLLRKDKPAAYGDCHLSWDATDLNPCVFGPPDGPRVVLMGDSHAVSWLPALQAIAEEEGWRLESHTKSSCMVLTKPIDRHDEPYTHCREWGEKLLADLRRSPPALVIQTQHRLHKLAPSSDAPDAEQVGSVLADMWRELLGLGVKVVGIVDTPRLVEAPEDCLLRDPACAMNQDEVLEGADPINVAHRLAPEAAIVDMNDALCREGKCPIIIGNIIAWRDRHHLTASYSRSMTKAFKERIFGAIGDSGRLRRGGAPH